MSKKSFADGIDAVLGGSKPSSEKKASSPSKEREHSAQRTSIYLNSDLLEKLKAIAFWERSLIKLEIEAAIDQYISSKDPEIVEKALRCFRENQSNKKK